jgi:hypothetical protein
MALPLPMNPLNDHWVLPFSILFSMMIIAVAFTKVGKLDEDLTQVYFIKTWLFVSVNMGAD